MTLREFIHARLREEQQVAESELITAQAMGPPGLYMYPNATLKLNGTINHAKTTSWLLDYRLRDAPRAARVNTMKALAYRWRTHPHYDPEWSPS